MVERTGAESVHPMIAGQLTNVCNIIAQRLHISGPIIAVQLCTMMP